ncbi:hypothetical protein HYV71_01020 [Candidatus Uhrbacteria bacterium]|nr:hypothetical protein [Candidatus Uhrbacteria bacterium]
MFSIEELNQEVAALKERNRRVEADKAWETSLTRKVAILVITYFIVFAFFLAAGVPRPFVNAVVPTLAFALSTATLPYLKKYWLKGRL